MSVEEHAQNVVAQSIHNKEKKIKIYIFLQSLSITITMKYKKWHANNCLNTKFAYYFFKFFTQINVALLSFLFRRKKTDN
jgi:hypothetical protein